MKRSVLVVMVIFLVLGLSFGGLLLWLNFGDVLPVAQIESTANEEITRLGVIFDRERSDVVLSTSWDGEYVVIESNNCYVGEDFFKAEITEEMPAEETLKPDWLGSIRIYCSPVMMVDLLKETDSENYDAGIYIESDSVGIQESKIETTSEGLSIKSSGIEEPDIFLAKYELNDDVINMQEDLSIIEIRINVYKGFFLPTFIP